MINLVANYIIPAALSLLPERMSSKEAIVMLLAIAGQESGFSYRRQVGGPARGLWQFERIGVEEVFRNPSSAEYANEVSARLLYNMPGISVVHNALTDNDILACAMSRLALWRDPHLLPAIGDEDGAWALYERIWRPGKPHPERWHDNYVTALEHVNGN